MQFIELSDITDDILCCTEEDVDAANAYVLGLAEKYRIAGNKLAQPAKYTVKRIAVCYACYIRAINSTGSDAAVAFGSNGESRDINYQKARLYRQELDGLVNNLAAKDFTNEEVNGSMVINVFRS